VFALHPLWFINTQEKKMDKNTFSLYIHFPFCLSKCHYCNFLSVPFNKPLYKEYVNYLKREIELYTGMQPFSGLSLDTIYIGGGTPSLMDTGDVEEIFQVIKAVFNTKDKPEITLETNPNSVTLEKLKGFRKCGINRLTIGAQSLHEEELKILGRTHTPRDFFTAFENARKAEFNNIGVDLMFGIPAQSEDSLIETLREIIELSPEHISTYSLTLEEGTYLKHLYGEGKLEIPGDESVREFYKIIIELLSENGYLNYEISNFAKQGYECTHNKNYWNFTPYLALGLGSHSFDGKKRFWNTGEFARYFEMLEKNEFPIESEEVLTGEQRKIETVMLGLRQEEGIDLNDFETLFGTDEKESLLKKTEDLNAVKNYFFLSTEKISLTVEGKMVMDELVLSLLE